MGVFLRLHQVVATEQSLERCEGLSHMDILGKKIPVRRNNKCKHCQSRVGHMYSWNSKEASMPRALGAWGSKSNTLA